MRGPFSLVIVRTGRDRFRIYLEGDADGAPPAGTLAPRYVRIASQPGEGFRSEEAAHARFLDLLSEARRDEYGREEAAAHTRRGIRIPEGRVLRSSDLVRRLQPGRTLTAEPAGR